MAGSCRSRIDPRGELTRSRKCGVPGTLSAATTVTLIGKETPDVFDRAIKKLSDQRDE